MALFGRWRSDDEPTLEQLRGWHLLLLPPEVTAVQVDSLVACRYPDANLADSGRAQLGRRSMISGPYLLEPDELDDVRVPAPWNVAYALEVDREPDPAAFDDIADPALRAWWMRAFPQGKPFREEGDAVDLGLALARRFGGMLRASGSNAVLRPDAERLLDLTVWSGYWLEPERLMTLLSPVLPGANLAVGGHLNHRPAPNQWPPAGPDLTPWSTDPLDPVRMDLEQALGQVEMETLHQVGDQHDTAARRRGAVLDGFAIRAEGDLVVEAIQEDAVPAWVRDEVGHQLLLGGDPAVTFVVRWAPQDVLGLESEDPPYGFRLERERVRPRMRAAALAIAEATAGVVSDSAGFEVDRYVL
jgi:hypothetical protein